MLWYVIRVMLIYHLMSMLLNAKGFNDLGSISQDILRGKNKSGEYTKALVTLKDISHCKVEGGMDYEDFCGLNLIFKMRWCGHLLIDNSIVWMTLARESIERSLNMGLKS